MLAKYLPLIGALLAASPAYSVTVNMSGFGFGSLDVVMQGTQGVSPSYTGPAGEFDGSTGVAPAIASTLRFSTVEAVAPTSFVAWCAELTQTFNFGVTYEYDPRSGVAYFGAQKTTNLSRLFTAAQGFVVDNLTSAAMQAGIWEVIYETDPTFSLTGGKFTGAPQNPAGQHAFDIVNGFLSKLGDYQANARIDVLQNDFQQDFLVATVPEPETWLLFGLGLGVIGAMRRRLRA